MRKMKGKKESCASLFCIKMRWQLVENGEVLHQYSQISHAAIDIIFVFTHTALLLSKSLFGLINEMNWITTVAETLQTGRMMRIISSTDHGKWTLARA
jgi:hypothetical protein